MGNPIRESLEHMRKHGWCQEESITKDGQVCSLGALELARYEDLQLWGVTKYNWVMRDKSRLDQCVPYLARVIKDQWPEWYERYTKGAFAHTTLGDAEVVYLWNDEEDRTFLQVEKVFEKAAVLWDEVNG